MSDLPDRFRRAFESDGAFDPAATPGTFRATSTPLDATVAADRGDPSSAGAADTARLTVTVRAPTLSAVAEEAVAPAVADGWFETVERRVADAGDVRRGGDVEPSVERVDGQLVVRLAFAARNPPRAVDDSRALVGFVEGTYVQGAIPGYDYGEPLAGLLHAARGRGG